MSGLIVSAPGSGSGKTTITLGVLRALRRRGVAVRSAKSGPDYIDPRFHEAASGAPCCNLDPWAMSPDRIRSLAWGPEMLVVEGAMGLFDGAPPDGRGATADLARLLGLPVVLVVDCTSMGHSVAALARGFAGHDPAVRIAGVILNKTGSERHERMLRTALEALGMPVFGALRRSDQLDHPSRHLGLVQAGERPDLEAFLDRAADLTESGIDIDALLRLAGSVAPPSPVHGPPVKPPGQRIAVARDQAFAFAYPHLLDDWRRAGAELAFFSPLADAAVPEADFIFLPGGYPELHAGRIAHAARFMQSLRNAAQTTAVYGECGGYMVLGDALVDADGHSHQMAGLLRLETSFARRKLHLGYRSLSCSHGVLCGDWTGHEFHYATTVRAQGKPLFAARDAEGHNLSPMGLIDGRVFGSFAHLIDRAEGGLVG